MLAPPPSFSQLATSFLAWSHLGIPRTLLPRLVCPCSTTKTNTPSPPKALYSLSAHTQIFNQRLAVFWQALNTTARRNVRQVLPRNAGEGPRIYPIRGGGQPLRRVAPVLPCQSSECCRIRQLLPRMVTKWQWWRRRSISAAGNGEEASKMAQPTSVAGPLAALFPENEQNRAGDRPVFDPVGDPARNPIKILMAASGRALFGGSFSPHERRASRRAARPALRTPRSSTRPASGSRPAPAHAWGRGSTGQRRRLEACGS
jgi:hypothetical protein